MAKGNDELQILVVAATEMQNQIRMRLSALGMSPVLVGRASELAYFVRGEEIYKVVVLPAVLPDSESKFAWWPAFCLVCSARPAQEIPGSKALCVSDRRRRRISSNFLYHTPSGGQSHSPSVESIPMKRVLIPEQAMRSQTFDDSHLTVTYAVFFEKTCEPSVCEFR